MSGLRSQSSRYHGMLCRAGLEMLVPAHGHSVMNGIQRPQMLSCLRSETVGDGRGAGRKHVENKSASSSVATHSPQLVHVKQSASHG